MIQKNLFPYPLGVGAFKASVYRRQSAYTFNETGVIMSLAPTDYDFGHASNYFFATTIT